MYTPSPMRNGAMGGGAFFDALHLLSSHISICVHVYVLQRTTKGATGRHIHSCVGCFRTMREKGCPSAMIISPLETQEPTRTFVFAFDDTYAKHFSVALLSLSPAFIIRYAAGPNAPPAVRFGTCTPSGNRPHTHRCRWTHLSHSKRSAPVPEDESNARRKRSARKGEGEPPPLLSRCSRHPW